MESECGHPTPWLLDEPDAIAEPFLPTWRLHIEELDPMGHGCTYSGHPLGANAGLANLEILEW